MTAASNRPRQASSSKRTAKLTSEPFMVNPFLESFEKAKAARDEPFAAFEPCDDAAGEVV
jgi:hypothetical protein